MLRNHHNIPIGPQRSTRRRPLWICECSMRLFCKVLSKGQTTAWRGVGSDSSLLIHCGMQASSRHHVAEGNWSPPSWNQAFYWHSSSSSSKLKAQSLNRSSPLAQARRAANAFAQPQQMDSSTLFRAKNAESVSSSKIIPSQAILHCCIPPFFLASCLVLNFVVPLQTRMLQISIKSGFVPVPNQISKSTPIKLSLCHHEKLVMIPYIHIS